MKQADRLLRKCYRQGLSGQGNRDVQPGWTILSVASVLWALELFVICLYDKRLSEW